jgi:predicted dehydrogenase
VAVLGTGDEGNVLINAINPDYITVKAIADIRPFNVHRACHGDVSSATALAARCGLMTKYGWNTEHEARKHVKVYSDYRELLANEKDIEAVIVGLPLHLHADASIQAMRKGYHVLCEKLMAHTVGQCKEMAREANRLQRHLATGHQRHYNILYQEAVDTIKRGVLGDIHYIRGQWHRNNRPGSDSWQLPMPELAKRNDPQARRLTNDLNRLRRERDSATGREIEAAYKRVAQVEAQINDFVLSRGGTLNVNDQNRPGIRLFGRDTFKTAQDYGYHDATLFENTSQPFPRPALEELLRWRLFQRTGGGLMVELGSHQLDAASIFLTAQMEQKNSEFVGKKLHPLAVLVSANRNLFGNDREVADHVTAMVEFPSWDYDANSKVGRKRKIAVQYSTINGNGFGGYGEVVYGTEGTLVLATEATSEILKSGGATAVKADTAAVALDTQASGPAQAAVSASGAAEVSRGYQEQMEHWAWCVRVNPKNRDKTLQPRCKPEVALTDAVIALVTNEAAIQGGKMKFEDSWFDIDSDDTPEGIKPDITKEDFVAKV